MSRTAATTLVATVVFIVSGGLSGLLMDEYGGVLGAFEWVLRTLVVVSLPIALGAAFGLILRLRRRVKPRAMRWPVTLVATTAFVFLVVQPTVYAVYLTHLPTRRAVHDVDLGAPKRPVTLATASGLRLRGWYVPRAPAPRWRCCTARAAIASAWPITCGCSRGTGTASCSWTCRVTATATGARPAFPHGSRRAPTLRSPTFAPARTSARAASASLTSRSVARSPSMPRRRDEWRATVLEGVQGVSPADMKASEPDPASFATITALYGRGRMLGGAAPPASDPEQIERIAPRPLLLLSAGRGSEARANADYKRHGASSTELWNLPAAPHAAALRTDPAGYEQHVIGFLDRSLL